MKKVYLLILLLLCGFLFIGCENKNEVEDPVKDPEPVHEHTFEEGWSFDENYHFHNATCGHDVVSDKTPHAFNDWHMDPTAAVLGTEKRECKICGIKEKRVVEPTKIDLEDKWSYNEEFHFHFAVDSPLIGDKEAHDYDEWEEVVSATVISNGLKMRTCKVCGYTEQEQTPKLEVLQIPKLQAGDTVALLCPASPTTDANITKAKQKLEGYGFKVKIYASATNGNSYGVSYLALSDEVRAQELNECFGDPTIKGIICMRGGYGSSRTLDLLDYDLIRNNPKFFTGYSDITALSNALYFKCGLISYHGFMGVTLASSSLDTTTENDILDILFNNQEGKVLNYGEYVSKSSETVTGELVGGNLSLISHLLGSEYMPDYSGKIIFIEDTGESEYSLDRLITKLRLFGCFDNAKAIVVGYLTGMSSSYQKTFITRMLGDLDIPVLFGFPSGHEYPFINLPIGATVEVSPNGLKIVSEVYTK